MSKRGSVGKILCIKQQPQKKYILRFLALDKNGLIAANFVSVFAAAYKMNQGLVCVTGKAKSHYLLLGVWLKQYNFMPKPVL